MIINEKEQLNFYFSAMDMDFIELEGGIDRCGICSKQYYWIDMRRRGSKLGENIVDHILSEHLEHAVLVVLRS